MTTLLTNLRTSTSIDFIIVILLYIFYHVLRKQSPKKLPYGEY